MDGDRGRRSGAGVGASGKGAVPVDGEGVTGHRDGVRLLLFVGGAAGEWLRRRRSQGVGRRGRPVQACPGGRQRPGDVACRDSEGRPAAEREPGWQGCQNRE